MAEEEEVTISGDISEEEREEVKADIKEMEAMIKGKELAGKFVHMRKKWAGKLTIFKKKPQLKEEENWSRLE